MKLTLIDGKVLFAPETENELRYLMAMAAKETKTPPITTEAKRPYTRTQKMCDDCKKMYKLPNGYYNHRSIKHGERSPLYLQSQKYQASKKELVSAAPAPTEFPNHYAIDPR